MPRNAFTSIFTRSAAKTVLAVTISLLGELGAPVDTFAQDSTSVQRAATAPDLNTAHNLKSVKVVTWGDSIGNGMGMSLSGVFNTVVNLGHDGAGLTIANKPEPLDNIPKGAAVLISMGTNDVENYIGAPQKSIDAYAQRVVKIAQEVQAQGGIPILVGMQAPLAPYTGNPRWSEPGFLEKWTKTMVKVNAAIQDAAKKDKIAYSVVQGRVPERKTDNLHYTQTGSRHMVANALKDAGIRY